MTQTREGSVSLGSLILAPALVTLAVTLLRLVGELLNWSPVFFARAAGGAGAIVGIVWLVPIFGIYFAWKLARSGPAPKAGAVVGLALLGFAIVAGSIVLTGLVLKLGQDAQFGVVTVACMLAAGVAYRGWPALNRALFTYGLAARVPVAVVMLIAIYANWGTHYDVPPPGFPEMAPLAKWFFIGLIPQMFMWVPFTMVAGALCGGLTLLVVGRSRPAD